jgi:2-hydroxy-3-keto-5-methylthiopentenyl-1-phosphate phosphatase
LCYLLSSRRDDVIIGKTITRGQGRLSTMSSWKILCDFDGTIVPDDVTDFLLENFAADTWREIERQWEDGQIGAQDCMRRQVELLDVAPAILDNAVAQMAVDAGFVAFVNAAEDLAVPLTIVSDGLDRVIKDVLRRHKLPDVEIKSSRFDYMGDGRWRLGFPNASASCRSSACTCKCAIAERDGRRTLLIGDGRSDFCLAEAAEFVFAKDKLLSHCRERGIAHAAFRNFSHAERLLRRLVAWAPTAPRLGADSHTHG